MLCFHLNHTLSKLIGKLNPGFTTTFEVVKIDGTNQKNHFDVLKVHWNSLWTNGGGFRFVRTYYGTDLCWWLCCGYAETTYGTALQFHYNSSPAFYRIQNGVWVAPIVL